MISVVDFVAESNRIEGINRKPTEAEITAHLALLNAREITVQELETFVNVIQPGAVLRRAPGQNVRVGSHVAPYGGPAIERGLRGLLAELPYDMPPYEAHIAYEKLHPFVDGNGRSGRALWAWHMRQTNQDPFALPFLHRWYYQSLDAARR